MGNEGCKLQSLERTERMMVRWMCGRIESAVWICTVFWVYTTECAGCGEEWQMRWFGHLECKSVDDWVSACRNGEVAGVRSRGRNRKTRPHDDA